MTKLHRLYSEQQQSPWLDNLTRDQLRDGTLQRLVADGIRGVTANPTILARAIEGSAAYDDQLSSLAAAGCSVEDAYWEVVVDDVSAALALLRPVFLTTTAGDDGFVSVEVAPELAHDAAATIAAVRALHQRFDRPNLLVKVPATPEGIAAVQEVTAEGCSINITLIFSLARYAEVIEAYLSGLEAFATEGGDVSGVRSVASFFVSRVDTEVDRRLEGLGTDAALALRGRAAVAQAKLAYQLYVEQFSGERWQRLADFGAHRQLPLWASTSAKNPAYPDTRYVDELIGPGTVNTMPETVVTAFEDHGTVARTIDTGVAEAAETMRRLVAVGIDIDDVGLTLEDNGVASFGDSYQHLLGTLEEKRQSLARL